MFEFLEKLIREHGSASIILERVRLIEAEYAALERRCADLEAENRQLKATADQQASRLRDLDSMTTAYACHHCGSTDLQRTGSRPNPTFGVLGMNDLVFHCGSCGQESLITPPD